MAEMRDRLDRLREVTARQNLIVPPAYFASDEQTIEYASLRDYFRQLYQASDEPGPLHLYLHVPFCEERCRFCIYYYDRVSEHRVETEEYTHQLCGMIRWFSQAVDRTRIEALYVGGGTASVLSSSQMERVLYTLRE